MPDYVRLLPLTALFTAAMYLFLILGFRIIGRRQLGQLTVVDLGVIIVMGSAVETAMVAGNVSLPAGFVSAATLLIVNRAFNDCLSRSKWLRHLALGGPTLLVNHGHVIEEHLRRAGLTHADIEQAVRLRGYSDLSDVKFAVLEEDGEINVVAMSVPTIQAKLGPPSSPSD